MRTFVASLFFSVLTVASCSQGKPQGAVVDDVYRMPLSDQIQTLNPREVRFRPDYQIMKEVFGQLIGVDQNGYLEPRVCERWEVDESFREYTLYLRGDARFHDGLPVLADDVDYSFHYEGKNPTLLYKALSDIEGYQEYYEGKASRINGIRTDGDRKVIVRLKRPSSTFLYALADGRFAILPYNLRGKSEAEFFNRPIGVGPYRLEIWNPPLLRIVRNNDYFGEKGKIKTFEFITVGKSKAIKGFNNGEFEDLVSFNVTPNDVVRKGARVKLGSAFSTHMLFFNVKKSTLKDRNIRLAVRAALDKRALVEKCYPYYDVANGVIPDGLVGAIDTPEEADEGLRFPPAGRLAP